MGRNKVILLILIMQSLCVFGFYLSEVKDQTDVYQVKEDKASQSLTIINPKPQKPTLREIIYYHVVEKPYEQEQVMKQHISDTGLNNNDEIKNKKQQNMYGNKKSIENIHKIVNKDKISDTDSSVIDKEQTFNKHNVIDNDMNEYDLDDSEYIDDEDVNDNFENYIKEVNFDDDHRKFTNGHGYQYFNNDQQSEEIPDESTADNDEIINTDSKELEANPSNPLLTDDEMIDTDSKELADQSEPVDNDNDYNVNSEQSLNNNMDIEDDYIMPDKNQDNNLDEETESRIENLLEFLKSVKEKSEEHMVGNETTFLTLEKGDNNLMKRIMDIKRSKRETNDSVIVMKIREKIQKFGLDIIPDFFKLLVEAENETHIVTKRNQIEDMATEEGQPSGIEDASVHTSRQKRELKEGKTYGMTLNGDNGVVWNDLNSRRIFYHVGQESEENKDSKIESALTKSDDEVINERIAKFKGELEEPALNEQPLFETSTEELSTEKPSTDKPIINKPSSEELTEKPEIVEANDSDSNKPSKTYGMTLAGDSGTIWNDLNGQRVSYHVGDSGGDNEDKISSENKPYKASKDNEEINAKIEQFEKDLGKSTSAQKPDYKEPSTAKPISEKPTYDESRTDKPTTLELGNMELVTSKPIYEEAITKEPEKPVKTYGMSLNSDHGIVWNDLNDHRVSYHVGESTTENEENTGNNIPEADLNEISANVQNSSDIDSNDDDSDLDSPSKLEAAINEIFGNSKESDTPQDNVITNDTIKEIIKNEIAKLEEKLICSNSNENYNDNEDSKNDSIHTPANNMNGNGNKIPEDINEVTNNEQFWKWMNDWSSTYTELLINRVNTHIKEEVSKQVQEFFATHEYDKSEASQPEKVDCNDAIDDKKEVVDSDNIAENVDNEEESNSKRRPDKNENKKNETPVKINTSNVYGSSIGNGNVTNIFVFNIDKKSDLLNVKPLISGTDGIYVFGNDDENRETNKDNVELQEDKDKLDAQITGNESESSSNVPNDKDTTEHVTSEEANVDEEKYDVDKHDVGDAENSSEENKNVSEEKVDSNEKMESNDESEISKSTESQDSNENKDNESIESENDDSIDNDSIEVNSSEQANEDSIEINSSEEANEDMNRKSSESEEDNVTYESSTEENKNVSKEKIDTIFETASNDGSGMNENTASQHSNEDEDNDSSESEDKDSTNKDSVEVSSSQESKEDDDSNKVQDAKSSEENKNVSDEKVDTDNKKESYESEINKDTVSLNSNENNDIESSESENSNAEEDDENKHNTEDTNSGEENNHRVKTKKIVSAKDKSTEEKDKQNAREVITPKKVSKKKSKKQ